MVTICSSTVVVKVAPSLAVSRIVSLVIKALLSVTEKFPKLSAVALPSST